MCGRFTLTSPTSKLVEFFALLKPTFKIEPRYNIAPTQSIACIRQVDGFRSLTPMQWGLIPSLAKHKAEGAKMINARSETVAVKPAFRESFEARRCLIPANGFFEWKRSGSEKQPYLIRLRSQDPMAFAGLWTAWRDSESDQKVESVTVLTTNPNQLVRDIHDRMPVILSEESQAQWLASKASIATLQSMLVPLSADEMEAFPVSRCVGNVRNDSPKCTTPIETRTQRNLF